jgi:aromatic ring-cleaving dioxygenase
MLSKAKHLAISEPHAKQILRLRLRMTERFDVILNEVKDLHAQAEHS